MNIEHKIEENMPNAVEQIKEKLGLKIKKDILAKYKKDIIEIKIFGSYVDGTATPESDIDVCFFLKDENKSIISEIENALYFIGLENDVLISPSYFFEYEIKQKIYEYAPFYNAVMAKGVSI